MHFRANLLARARPRQDDGRQESGTMTQVGPVTVTPRDDRPLVAGEHATWTYRIRLVGGDVEPGGCVKIGYDLRPGLGYHDFPQHDEPGLAAVWASELSRQAVFEALWNRRTYAVSGSRIFLDFKVNGHMMGDEFALRSADQPRDVRIVIAGTAAIKQVELIHNNAIVKTWPGNKKWDMELDFQHAGRLEGLTADVRTNYYYVRVLQDNGHMAWSSPVWVDVSG